MGDGLPEPGDVIFSEGFSGGQTLEGVRFVDPFSDAYREVMGFTGFQ